MSRRLDPRNVPASLHTLIALAERFGISDDVRRESLVKATPKEQRAELVQTIARRDDELDAWLAGPEAGGPTFSAEYIAFSALRMAADYASAMKD